MDYILSPRRKRNRAKFRRLQEKEWQSKNGEVIVTRSKDNKCDEDNISNIKITENGERNGY